MSSLTHEILTQLGKANCFLIWQTKPYHNPSSGPERNMETVLCIFTYRRVFVLDMDKIPRDEDHQDATSPAVAPPPPSMRILDFVESELPLGMGLLKLGNFLYMFGGEYCDYGNDFTDIKWIRDDSFPPLEFYGYYSLVYGAWLPEEDPPCLVYRLDLTDHRSKPVKLKPMLGPKLYAVVEEIGGQIYILSKKHVSRSRPLFEVWNPITEKSRALPNPPSFSQCPVVANCRVFCRNIVCIMDNGDINCFNTASETWECVEDLPPRERMAMSGRFDVRNKDIILTKRVTDRNLWAIMDGPEGNAGHRIELMFDPSKTEPKIPGFSPIGYLFLADTSPHGEYMCGLVPYESDHVYGFALYVFVFQVEKHESTLLVRYLRRQFYDFTNIECRNEEVPLFDIKNAVM